MRRREQRTVAAHAECSMDPLRRAVDPQSPRLFTMIANARAWRRVVGAAEGSMVWMTFLWLGRGREEVIAEAQQ